MITLVKIYARIHEFFHTNLNINLRGLGFLYRRIQHDFIFEIKGKKMFFNHRIGDNYGRLLGNRFNEPETHIFLNSVFNLVPKNTIHFVDIGANIGEFLLDYADHQSVCNLTAFEPQPEQQKVLLQCIELNQFTKATVVPKPVAESTKEIFFNFNASNSHTSGITQDKSKGTALLTTSIDEYFTDTEAAYFVFLIDTEGTELDIMKGGKNLIIQKAPLIIFEYNQETQEHFQIEEVKSLLGDEYRIFKIQQDGTLSVQLEKSWNLVAIPNRSPFNSLMV